MDRRRFLTRTGLTVAAAALAATTWERPTSVAALWRDQPLLDDWDAVRVQFRLTSQFIHLGGNYLASHPTPVRQAIETHRLGLDENPVHYLHEHEGWLEAEVLREASAYLGVQPTEIALTDSTTMGLGLLYNGLELEPGDELLTTTHDFFATHEALFLKAARSGARVRQIPLYENIASVSEVEIVDSVTRAIDVATRVLAVTWVHSSTGLKLPIRGIAEALATINAQRDESERVLLCVDGVHGIGVENVTMADLGCDFFCAGTHKWLFGPRGTGIVWGTSDAWARVAPTIPSFSGGGAAGAFTPGGFHSFEHRWALAQAFQFHQSIGKAQVADRIHELNRQLKQGLATMSHVTLYTPMSDALSAGMVCFDVDGMTPAAMVAHLRSRGIIATTTPYRPSYARVAPGLFNNPAEIDTVLAEIRALA